MCCGRDRRYNFGLIHPYVQNFDLLRTFTPGLHGINMKVRTSLNIIEHLICLEIICTKFRLAWITHTWFEGTNCNRSELTTICFLNKLLTLCTIFCLFLLTFHKISAEFSNFQQFVLI